jgi:hypothetical protein
MAEIETLKEAYNQLQLKYTLLTGTISKNEIE